MIDPKAAPVEPGADAGELRLVAKLREGFFLPGLAGHQQGHTLSDMLLHICITVWDHAATLREVLDRSAESDSHGAAELAEVMAISEEIVAAGGLHTDLEGRNSADWTEAQNFAARHKLRALREPRQTVPACYEVFYFTSDMADDYEQWGSLPFAPTKGLHVQLGGDFWEVREVHWVSDPEAGPGKAGWFECMMKGPRRAEDSDYMKKGGWKNSGPV